MFDSRSKNEIRRNIKWLWRISSSAELSDRLRLIIDFFDQASFFKQADSVFSYHPIDFELAFTPQLFEKFSHKNYYLPTIVGDDLVFTKSFSGQKLIKNQLGVLEPALTNKTIDLADIKDSIKTLVLVPSMAADSALYRLGRGKGYYDRFLSKLSPKVCKVTVIPDFAFSYKSLPLDSWDKKLDKVLVVSQNCLKLYE